jgi:CRISPR/Cas system-associated exonuclease Cas4 (RecB family)
VADAVVSSNLTRSTRKKIGTVNSEFHIEDASYPIEGFIDLLVVGDQRDRILDFKTSKDIRPEYWEQLKLYAWLWSRCAENQLPKETELSVVTGIGTIEIISLTHEDLLSLEREISAKITESDRLISLKEPTAIPTTENCKFCAVKVVCDDYWESNVVSNAGKTDSWVDLRIRITSDLGGGNWKVTFLDTGEMGILLLGGRDDGSISVDAELRLLGVFKKVTEDDGICIRLSQASEIFLYSPPRK